MLPEGEGTVGDKLRSWKWDLRKGREVKRYFPIKEYRKEQPTSNCVAYIVPIAQCGIYAPAYGRKGLRHAEGWKKGSPGLQEPYKHPFHHYPNPLLTTTCI